VVLPSLLGVFFHLAKFGKDCEGGGQVDDGNQGTGQRPVGFKAANDGNHAGRHKPDDERVKNFHF
jgi:hypothetical protein